MSAPAGRVYLQPERCVDLHAALMRCYEAVCEVEAARRMSSPGLRSDMFAKALGLMDGLVEPMRALMLDDPPWKGPDLSPEVAALVAESRANAIAHRHYLRTEALESLHALLTDCYRLACMVRHNKALSEPTMRQDRNRDALRQLATLQPQFVTLVVPPPKEGKAVAA